MPDSGATINENGECDTLRICCYTTINGKDVGKTLDKKIRRVN